MTWDAPHTVQKVGTVGSMVFCPQGDAGQSVGQTHWEVDCLPAEIPQVDFQHLGVNTWTSTARGKVGKMQLYEPTDIPGVCLLVIVL
jgi:hypothetical protein